MDEKQEERWGSLRLQKRFRPRSVPKKEGRRKLHPKGKGHPHLDNKPGGKGNFLKG